MGEPGELVGGRRARLASALAAPADLTVDLRLPAGSLVGPIDNEDHSSSELEDLEGIVSAGATAALTRAELEAEIASLDELVPVARQVHASGDDTKWTQLKSLLEDTVLTQGPNTAARKIIASTYSWEQRLAPLADIVALSGRKAAA